MAGRFRVAVMVGPKMFRGAVVSVLGGVPGLRVVGDGSEGVTGEFLKMNRVDLVVVDADLGGLDRVLEVLPEGCGAILVSRDGEAPRLPSWRLTRVVGVVSAEAEVGELLAMVRERMRPRAGGVGELSQREAEVYQSMGRGLTSREIGEALGISGQTVQVHLRNVAMKWGISGRELRMRALAEQLRGNGAGEV
jgi:DNA-binding CsgD family transcriptional regulator